MPGEQMLTSNRVFPMLPVASGLKDVPPGGLRGICPVCGNEATFTKFTDNERESGQCSSCSSFNRQRQMAALIRELSGLAPTGPLRFAAGYNIYNTESTGALHGMLLPHGDYMFSEYFGPDIGRGAEVRGVRNEDLQQLSFPDASFDLLLSSDVLEHMPRPYDAHREIYRVLKPGGRHIFTVPYNPGAPLDDVRAVERDGRVEYFGEKLYHGDPVRPGEGILVWTIFGLQMFVEIARIGFRMTCWNLDRPEQGIIGPWSVVFDAYKPA